MRTYLSRNLSIGFGVSAFFTPIFKKAFLSSIVGSIRSKSGKPHIYITLKKRYLYVMIKKTFW